MLIFDCSGWARRLEVTVNQREKLEEKLVVEREDVLKNYTQQMQILWGPEPHSSDSFLAADERERLDGKKNKKKPQKRPASALVPSALLGNCDIVTV